MKLLNIGCGAIFHAAWLNLDLVPLSPDVHAHDLRTRLPYSDASFEACYSSHVLEHLSRYEAQRLLNECLRILKPQGIVRIVVPDLEAIVRNYLSALEKVEAGITEAEANYDWMMLELYDQTVRDFTGGEMGRYLSSSKFKNKDFVLSRLGFEAEIYFKTIKIWDRISSKKLPWFIEKFRLNLAKGLVVLIAGPQAASAFSEGWFRNSGEIHRWMYDRFSLRRMIESSGFTEVRICRADESRIPGFNCYELDIIEGNVRKPDSLFMEGRKP